MIFEARLCMGWINIFIAGILNNRSALILKDTMQIALAQINPIVGALVHNRKKIVDLIERARNKNVDLIVFPEMALCGYPPEDLLLFPSFIHAISTELQEIVAASKGITAIVGCVRESASRGEKGLRNSAAIIQNGALIGFQDKSLLPDYDVFSERRYFEPAACNKVWSLCNARVGITICEDIWQHAEAVEYSTYPKDPVLELKEQMPDILINLSASPYYMQRHQMRLRVCELVAKTLNCPVLFCNQVGGNDSLIFDGYSLYLDKGGNLIHYGKGFEEDFFIVDLEKQEKPCTLTLDPQKDLYQALVLGVRDYFFKQGFSKACFGLSGGIDSSVVACIAADALGKENILALILPSRYSSASSTTDATALSRSLGIASKEISIEEPFETFLGTLEPHFQGRVHDVTEENLQARIRGILLMAFANKFGYLVLGTGNKSEMAMGYATLYGDMCGGLGVINDVTKEQVYLLAKWINRDKEIIPLSVLSKPPSAELKFNQKDSDSLPEYPIIDSVLKEYIEEHQSPETIAKKQHLSEPLVKELVRKIHLNEYKRRQAPPGLRVTKKAFTVGHRFPIVQKWNIE